MTDQETPTPELLAPDEVFSPDGETETETPSNSELRIAQAQLVGWLEGLFHGIQAALMAQQMAARAQLDQMRNQSLPEGGPGPSMRPGTYL